MAAAGASAALLQLEATSTDPEYSGFKLVFDDRNGDQLFQFGELLSTTGVTAFGDFYARLLSAPAITGASTASGSCAFAGYWCFGRTASSGLMLVEPDAMRYTVSAAPSAVPEPASLALAALALAAAAGSTRGRAR